MLAPGVDATNFYRMMYVPRHAGPMPAGLFDVFVCVYNFIIILFLFLIPKSTCQRPYVYARRHTFQRAYNIIISFYYTLTIGVTPHVVTILHYYHLIKGARNFHSNDY